MKHLWLNAYADIVESIRARWFMVYTAVFGGLVVLLFAYHFKCHQIVKQFQVDEVKYTSRFMRIWNEVATLILFSVVFLAVLKNAFNWIYGVVGIMVLGVLLMIGIKAYKRYRENHPDA